MVLMAGVSAAFLAGDLFNFFVAVEILLMSSYVLITLEGVDDQIRSGTTYIVINVLESILLVMAVALVFAATGTLSMADLPERLAALPDGVQPGPQPAAAAGVRPEGRRVPAVLLVARQLSRRAQPGDRGLRRPAHQDRRLRHRAHRDPAVPREPPHRCCSSSRRLTMVVGVLGAIAQSDMKRILSFHIVSQIGYMIMGLALGGAAAIAATIFFILHQIPIKTSLFLVEGIVERDTGSSTLGRVSGLARRSGWLALAVPRPVAQPRRPAALLGLHRQGRPRRSRGRPGPVVDPRASAWPCRCSPWCRCSRSGPASSGGRRTPAAPRAAACCATTRSCRASPSESSGSAWCIALAAGPIYRYCERAAESIVNPSSTSTTVNGHGGRSMS